MKIKYISKPTTEQNLTTDKEYYCCEIMFSTTNAKLSTLVTIFDDQGFLTTISNKEFVLIDGNTNQYWELYPPKATPEGGPYSGFMIEFRDKRLDDIGDFDIVIDLPCHILDQEETGDDFFDTDKMKKRLDDLRKSIEKEHL